jgi:death-on-curing protein
LFYGICANHPFHNGNKRTAFVTTLVHLNRNELVLRGASDNEIYSFLTAVAGHQIRDRSGRLAERSKEFPEVVRWWKDKISKMKKGDRPITFRQLRQILRRYKFELRNPHKNSIDVYALATEKRSTFLGLGFTRQTKERRVLNISYPGENFEISRQTLKRIRQDCGLTEQDGIDSAAFYDNEAIVDYFINHYRTLIERLAKT